MIFYRIPYGGTYGSRTRLRGFADRCVTAPPTRHSHHYIRWQMVEASGIIVKELKNHGGAE